MKSSISPISLFNNRCSLKDLCRETNRQFCHCRRGSLLFLWGMFVLSLESVYGQNVECYLLWTCSLLHPCVSSCQITTGRLQSGFEPEANSQRLKTLRRALQSIAPRWLAGGEKVYQPHCTTPCLRVTERYTKLLDEDTSPRILKALSNNPNTRSVQ